MKRILTAVLLTLVLATALAPSRAPQAHAEIVGPCTATVNGQQVGPLDSSDPDQAIKVKKDDTITIVMTSAIGFESHKIDMEFAGLRIPLQDEPDGGDLEWSGSADVADYSDFGVGLYKVVGEGRQVDGTSCTGSVLIEVEGSALTSIAGLVALGLLVFGLLVLSGTLFGEVNRANQMRKQIQAWAEQQARRIVAGENVTADELRAGLRAIAKPRPPITLWMLPLVPLFVLMGAVPGEGSPPGGKSLGTMSLGPISLPRLPLRPGMSIAGSIGGIIATQAVVVLVQQFAISPLTASNEIIGLVAGLVLAAVFATAVKPWGARHANDAIKEAETRLNEAIAQVRREAGLPPAPPDAPGAPSA